MGEAPWQSVIVANLVGLIVVCATVLAYIGVAGWRDVFTIYLIVLSGLGFMTSGIYYGQARAFREVVMWMTRREQQEEKAGTASSLPSLDAEGHKCQ